MWKIAVVLLIVSSSHKMWVNHNMKKHRSINSLTHCWECLRQEKDGVPAPAFLVLSMWYIIQPIGDYTALSSYLSAPAFFIARCCFQRLCDLNSKVANSKVLNYYPYRLSPSHANSRADTIQFYSDSNNLLLNMGHSLHTVLHAINLWKNLLQYHLSRHYQNWTSCRWLLLKFFSNRRRSEVLFQSHKN